MLKEEVDAEDVAEVVAKWTGIPVSRMLESEALRLLRIEDRLRERVVGQDEALMLVANAVVLHLLRDVVGTWSEALDAETRLVLLRAQP